MLHAPPPGLAESPTAPDCVKRAVKACASCRHNKTRCDDVRPCGHCRKKGMNAEQCVYGCEACRRARANCDGGVPCSRCMSMHLNCVDGIARLIAAPNMQVKSGGRAQLACKNCRRDNKKCEDQRPCRRCVLRGDDCIHVVRRPKLVKVRCQPCRDANRRCEDTRPCYCCSVREEVCVDPPRKGTGHGMRVKVACVKCRQHKDRTDPSKDHAWSGVVSHTRSSLDVTPTQSTPEPEFGQGEDEQRAVGIRPLEVRTCTAVAICSTNNSWTTCFESPRYTRSHMPSRCCGVVARVVESGFLEYWQTVAGDDGHRM
ncbi:hypothetical protein BC826DRAFT_255142 [Russula brevipes]|nr:hypothetical protein BC826DRAFT_255142 [Russula brevipes]